MKNVEFENQKKEFWFGVKVFLFSILLVIISISFVAFLGYFLHP